MKQLKLKDFLDYKYISNLESNTSQTHFAYLVSKANLTNNNYEAQLFIHDGLLEYKALDLKDNMRFFWEDEHNILIPFAKTDEEKELVKTKHTILYRYNLQNKTFEKAHKLYIPVQSIKVIDENTWLLNTSLNIEAHALYEDSANRDDYLSTLESQALYEEITSIPFYADGGDFIRDTIPQVIIYNPNKNTYTRIFDKDIQVKFSEYNQDTQKIYFLTQTFNPIKSFYADAYVYDLKTNALEKLYTHNETIALGYLFEINNSYYAFGSDLDTYGINTNSNIYKIDNGKLDLVIKHGLSSYNSTGSDVRYGFNKTFRVIDNVLYFGGTYKDHTKLYRFDGELKEITRLDSIDGFIPFKNAFIIAGLQDSKLQELYTYNNKNFNQLTSINDETLKDKFISKPIYHSFKNGNIVLDGWVILPKDYDETKLYPAILDIHGGPKTIYNENFYHEMQVWANMGYIVYYSNPRGGDGYDDDFADIRGKYGTIDYEDIMAFTDYVLENYAIDENRLGVTGGSYGGFMTNWIVSHTDRFKVAATQRSISNWISFYGTSDIGYYFMPDQTDADPLLDHEKAWEQSPLKHAHNIKTPLLFIHSDKDYRCPIEQAMQLYTVVKKQGVETRFIWFKDESHGLSRDGRPQSRVKRLEEITNWFEKYLK